MGGRTAIWMLVFLAAVGVAGALLFPALRAAFEANPVFNGLILGVLLVGIGVNFRQVLALTPAHAWLAMRREDAAADPGAAPPMLAALARLLSEREGRTRLTTMAMRSLLDGVRLRLDEHRDISRYLVGLLIFLGLLGTFWGLLDTVSSAGEVIAGLSLGGEDVALVFERLKANLQGPLAGMGTAFSSSLFGLGGALVLGFLDLQAGHAENCFYKDLEDWLAGLARLPSGALGEGEAAVPAYIEALLEKTADSLESLERILARSEEDRAAMREQLLQLAGRLTELSDQIRSDQQLTRGLARQQQDLQPLLARLADAGEAGAATAEVFREHARGVDGLLQRLVEESGRDRRELVEELRKELRLLTRTLAGKE